MQKIVINLILLSPKNLNLVIACLRTNDKKYIYYYLNTVNIIFYCTLKKISRRIYEKVDKSN